jgi:hypothetical protein
MPEHHGITVRESPTRYSVFRTPYSCPSSALYFTAPSERTGLPQNSNFYDLSNLVIRGPRAGAAVTRSLNYAVDGSTPMPAACMTMHSVPCLDLDLTASQRGGALPQTPRKGLVTTIWLPRSGWKPAVFCLETLTRGFRLSRLANGRCDRCFYFAP